MSAHPLVCSACGERFGGIGSFDRHRLSRDDRCKTASEMSRSGFSRDASGVWHREKIADQTVLVDKRRVPAEGQRTRRGQAPRHAGAEGDPTTQERLFEAQEGAQGDIASSRRVRIVVLPPGRGLPGVPRRAHRGRRGGRPHGG